MTCFAHINFSIHSCSSTRWLEILGDVAHCLSQWRLALVQFFTFISSGWFLTVFDFFSILARRCCDVVTKTGTHWFMVVKPRLNWFLFLLSTGCGLTDVASVTRKMPEVWIQDPSVISMVDDNFISLRSPARLTHWDFMQFYTTSSFEVTDTSSALLSCSEP